MKVMLVTHGFPPDQMAGAEIYAYHIAQGLRRHGEDVVVFSPGVRSGLEEYAVERERVDELTVLRMQNTFRDLEQLGDTYANSRIDAVFARALDEERPDVVHVHHVIGTSIGVIDEAVKRRIPVVVTLHDFWFLCARGQRLTPRHHVCEEIEPWRCSLCIGKKRVRYFIDWFRREALGRPGDRPGARRLLRPLGALLRAPAYVAREAFPATIERRSESMLSALRRADLLISPSDFLRDEFIRHGIDAQKIVMSENGMDLERLRPIEPRREPTLPLRFGFVGTLIPSKGPDLLIDAFQSIDPTLAELHVHGAGGGPNARGLEASFRSRDRARRVHFHGRFDNARIGEILGSLDVLCVPSRWYENAPLTLHEAAVAGLAVVTADHGGMREFAERFGNALLFEAGSVKSLRAAIERFIADPRICTRLKSSRAVRTVDDDVRATRDRYLELIRAHGRA